MASKITPGLIGWLSQLSQDGSDPCPIRRSMLKYGNTVLSICRSKLWYLSPDMVDDAFAATFTVYWKKITSKQTPPNEEHFLKAAALHCSQEVARKWRRYNKITQRLPDDCEIVDDTNPGDVVARQELAQIVREAVAGLPDEEKQVGEAFLDGLTQHETADALGETRPWVQRRLKRVKVWLGEKPSLGNLTSIAPLVAALTADEASAGVPDDLIKATLAAINGDPSPRVAAIVTAVLGGAARARMWASLVFLTVACIATVIGGWPTDASWRYEFKAVRYRPEQKPQQVAEEQHRAKKPLIVVPQQAQLFPPPRLNGATLLCSGMRWNLVTGRATRAINEREEYPNPREDYLAGKRCGSPEKLSVGPHHFLRVIDTGTSYSMRLCRLPTQRDLSSHHTEIAAIDGINDAVQGATISEDGKLLFTTHWNGGDTRIWDVASAQEVAHIVTARCDLLDPDDLVTVKSLHCWTVLDSDGRFDIDNGQEHKAVCWVTSLRSDDWWVGHVYEPGLLAKRLGYDPRPLRPAYFKYASSILPKTSSGQLDFSQVTYRSMNYDFPPVSRDLEVINVARASW